MYIITADNMNKDHGYIVHSWTLNAGIQYIKYLLHEWMLVSSARLPLHGLRIQLKLLVFYLIRLFYYLYF